MPSTPVFNTLKVAPAVTALLGAGNNMRVYNFGRAPANVAKPYVVWQQITGFPNNNLSQLPENDEFNVQIDIYASSSESAEQVKNAIRDAIEPVMYITSWDGEGMDKETTLYRITFSVDWFVSR